MTTLTETLHAGGFIVSEANGHLSREVVTVASGESLKAGAVLGKITASGKYSAYDNADTTTGIGVAAAVLFDDVDATSADATGVAVVRIAEVATAGLVFESDQDSTAQSAALVDLKSAYIIAR